MNITQELAQKMIEVIDSLNSCEKNRSHSILKKKVIVGFVLPKKRQWWKEYGEKAKALKIKGPNLMEAAKILSPDRLVPIYDLVENEDMVEAYREAVRRGFLATGVRIGKSHWLRKIASGEMPPENNPF